MNTTTINIIYYSIIIIIVIISIKLVGKNCTPINDLVDKAYPNKDDNISTIIDRIEWANHYPGRIEYKLRYIIYSFILSLLLSVVLFGFNKSSNNISSANTPSGKLFLQTMITCWVVLVALQSFFCHHADKFYSYSIDENLKKLRKKLKKRKGKFNLLSKREEKFTGKDGCFTFYYKYID